MYDLGFRRRWLTQFERLCVMLTLLLGAVAIQGQVAANGTSRGVKDWDFQSPFRYVIVSGVTRTELYANRGPDYYVMDVLLEDRAFSEGNLITLFKLLSKRFSDRPALLVHVYTSLHAIRTPEEYDRIDLAGPKDDYYKYKYAFFSRNGNGERFQYGIPSVVAAKEVIITPAPAEWPPK